MATQVEKSKKTPKKPTTAGSPSTPSAVSNPFPLKDMERYMDGMFDTWRGMMHSFMHAADGNGQGAKPPLDLEQWQRQTDNYFADVQRRWAEIAKLTPLSMFNPMTRLMAPQFDLSDQGDHYMVSGAVPGLDVEDLSVEIDGHMLCISGQHSEQAGTYDGPAAFSLSHTGMFSQTVCLPADAYIDGIDATVSKGVLTIRLEKDKTVSGTSKSIPVNRD